MRIFINRNKTPVFLNSKASLRKNTFSTTPPIELLGKTILTKPDKELSLKQKTAKNVFLDSLVKCSDLFFKKSTVFISYSWGIKAHEQWCDELNSSIRTAKFSTLFDRDVRNGGDLDRFMGNIEHADSILMVATPTYKHKYEVEATDEKTAEPGVKAEVRLLNRIRNFSSKRSEKIIPLLLEGTKEDSIPFPFQSSKYIDFIYQDHFDGIFEIIQTLCAIDRHNSQFEAIKEKFKQSIIMLTKPEYQDYEEQYKRAQEKRNNQMQKDIEAELKKHIDSHLRGNHQHALQNYSSTSKTDIILSSKNNWGIPFFNHQRFINRIINEGNKQIFLSDKIFNSFFKNSNPNSVTMVILSGLAGVGKTQLALNYAYNSHTKYQLQCWFTAANPQELESSYYKFGLSLNLFDPSLSHSQAAKDVKKWLENTKENWLAIYDNAESYEEVKPYLPERGGHILITSRKQFDWPVESLLVTDLLPIDREVLVEKILGYRNSDVSQLVKTLGGLPIVLAGASSYIHMTNISIKRYLKLFQIAYNQLLNNKDHLPADYNKTTISTFNITLDYIRNVQPKTLEFLNYCAYLAADNIPRSLLMHCATNNITVEFELLFNNAIAVLKDYSLIGFNQ